MTQILTNAWSQPPPVPRDLADFKLSRRAPGVLFNISFGAIFGVVGGTVCSIVAYIGFASSQLPMLLIGGGLNLIFLAVGGFFLARGLKQRAALRQAWRDGSVAKGRITDIYRDRSIRVNNRSPVAIHYTFRVNNLDFSGKSQVFKGNLGRLGVGTVIAVVYDPSAPRHNLAYLG